MRLSGSVTTYDRVLTPRLELRAVTPEDLESVHDLHADPRVWQHLPSGQAVRHRLTCWPI